MAYKKLKFWFDGELAALLADKIRESGSDFNKEEFVQRVEAQVDPLELKDRVKVLSDELWRATGEDFVEGWRILRPILGPENPEETGMFTEYYWLMPVAKWVEDYGLNHFDLSMEALREITCRNTSEYAIRPFLEKYPEKTLARMQQWTQHPNFHVRRLASEGGRPRLPWASKLDQFITDPRPLLPILNELRHDTSKYVQKSVANCLNDILKDNEEIGRATLMNWAAERSPEQTWIMRHALRNYRKKEIPWALEFLKSL